MINNEIFAGIWFLSENSWETRSRRLFFDISLNVKKPLLNKLAAQDLQKDNWTMLKKQIFKFFLEPGQ